MGGFIKLFPGKSPREKQFRSKKYDSENGLKNFHFSQVPISFYISDKADKEFYSEVMNNYVKGTKVEEEINDMEFDLKNPYYFIAYSDKAESLNNISLCKIMDRRCSVPRKDGKLKIYFSNNCPNSFRTPKGANDAIIRIAKEKDIERQLGKNFILFVLKAYKFKNVLKNEEPEIKISTGEIDNIEEFNNYMEFLQQILEKKKLMNSRGVEYSGSEKVEQIQERFEKLFSSLKPKRKEGYSEIGFAKKNRNFEKKKGYKRLHKNPENSINKYTVKDIIAEIPCNTHIPLNDKSIKGKKNNGLFCIAYFDGQNSSLFNSKGLNVINMRLNGATFAKDSMNFRKSTKSCLKLLNSLLAEKKINEKVPHNNNSKSKFVIVEIERAQ